MTQLVELAEAGDLDGVRSLLEGGVDINSRDDHGRTAAMAATYVHQIDVVRVLFNRGADPDLRDDMLNSPFLYAGAEGYLDILKLAHEAGANPAITNRFGGTALIPASEHGYVETVRFLLEETTVNVNHINNLGWTALLEAIMLNDGGPDQQNTIRLLIEHGADVNLADADGVTPLAHARSRGFSAIEEKLTRAGASE